MCEGLSKISSNFALHLIKVGKLKRFKKVSSDLKTILVTDLADLRFCCFLGFEKRRDVSINVTVKPGQAYPQDAIIQKLNPLVVVDFRFIAALLHA